MERVAPREVVRVQTRGLGAPTTPGPLVPALTVTFGRALLVSPDPLARAFGAAIVLRGTIQLVTDAVRDVQAALGRV